MQATYPLDLDDLVLAVGARLRVAREPGIFAVWSDGSVSKEPLGFVLEPCERKNLGSPLVCFDAEKRVSADEVRSDLLTALLAHNLLAV